MYMYEHILLVKFIRRPQGFGVQNHKMGSMTSFAELVAVSNRGRKQRRLADELRQTTRLRSPEVRVAIHPAVLQGHSFFIY